jgi:hypothetical protein
MGGMLAFMYAMIVYINQRRKDGTIWNLLSIDRNIH